MDVLLEILKWVVLVFLAGVVAQFGKSLTLEILESRRRKRAMTAPSETAPADPGRAAEDPKAAKKIAKAEQKRAKKAAKARPKTAEEEKS